MNKPADIRTQGWPAPECFGAEAYISRDYARAEADRLWPKVWQHACRLEEIPAVGDFVAYDIMDDTILIVRSGPDEISAFYLTDFLARQFDAFIWEPLGLDRHPELREMYFGHYTKLVYQAQTDDPALTARARACADRLGLAFERRLTGYGDLATTLQGWARLPSSSC